MLCRVGCHAASQRSDCLFTLLRIRSALFAILHEVRGPCAVGRCVAEGRSSLLSIHFGHHDAVVFDRKHPVRFTWQWWQCAGSSAWCINDNP
jgi:hypothetical protein